MYTWLAYYFLYKYIGVYAATWITIYVATYAMPNSNTITWHLHVICDLLYRAPRRPRLDRFHSPNHVWLVKRCVALPVASKRRYLPHLYDLARPNNFIVYICV